MDRAPVQEEFRPEDLSKRIVFDTTRLALWQDLIVALQKYIHDLDNDKQLRKKLDSVYGKKLIRQQYLKTPKFKNLVKDGILS